MPIDYKASGVDVDAANKEVDLLKDIVKKTYTKGVLSELGGFSGLFELDTDEYKNPVLVSGTDGVGTKLKLAFMMDKHDTVGIDCVAMCANDILCQGAKPLFFLDYIATGKLIPEKMAQIVSGVAKGCLDSTCALIGGETAEMPGFYSEGEYDIAGFCVGVVDKQKIITGEKIKPGDIILGLPSSGVHSNGFSLIRKLFFEDNKYKVDDHIEEFGKTLGEELLTPTRIYVKEVLDLLKSYEIKAMSHITGGGFYENIPRMLKDGLRAAVDMSEFDTPAVFQYIQKLGEIDNKEMYRTFNMGIGLVMVLDKEAASEIISLYKSRSEKIYVVGEIIEGERGIDLCL
ncbi:MAG TPA: phosphoribosylformylglycinamidine cyclo-ligase [Soehngenia sp.]|nr:phosphoribosylformylglycinamidine cyclo-ligase [Soehngenia sp.]